MKILQFINSLLGRLDKENILKDIQTTKEELDQVVAPSYAHASDFFRGNAFKADDVKSLEKEFYRKFDKGSLPKQNNFITEVNSRIKNVQDNLTYVEDNIEKLFEKMVITEGLTVSKTVLLRSAEHMSFISRFASDLLNYVYAKETMATKLKGEEAISMDQLSPAECRHVENNIGFFAMLLSDYGIPMKEFEKRVVEVPEVQLNKATADAVAAVYSQNKLDPFKNLPISGFTGNPIYHFRMVIAEWQTARYKAKEQKKRLLEMRLMHLEMVRENKQDAKVEQEIEYIRGRISKIERYMRDVEESLEQGD